MSSSSSSPKTTTTTTDARTALTTNAGIGGDISDSFVAAGNYGTTAITSNTSNDDNSFRVDMTDQSDNSNWQDFSDYRDQSLNVEMADSSQNTDNSVFMDESDNSLRVNMADNSGATNSGNTTNDYSVKSDYKSTTSTTNNVTDGGAFKVIESSFGKMIDVIGLSQKNTLAASTDLASRSLDAAMAIKRAEVNNTADNQITMTSLKVVGVAAMAFAATKIWGK